MTGNDGAAPPKVLLARLEHILGERAALLVEVERLEAKEAEAAAAAPDGPDSVGPLRERLKDLTREQELLLAELTALVPPHESPIDADERRRRGATSQER